MTGRVGSWLLVGTGSHIGVATETKIAGFATEVFRMTRDGSLGSIKLTLGEQIPNLPRAKQGGVAVIFAAQHGHEVCQADAEGTRRVNVDATMELCERLNTLGWHIVFISSEAAIVNESTEPTSEYGHQKREVENYLSGFRNEASVLRLSKVIDVKKEPWSNWIQDIKDGKAVFAFENYYLSPLAVSQASAAVLAVGSARSGGIWHASGLSSISYFEFLRILSKRLGTPSSVNAETRTSSRSHFVSGGSMDNSRIVNTGLWVQPSSDEVCDALVSELNSNKEFLC
jgi:dTDP-4-dehydrorhamnose reductase